MIDILITNTYDIISENLEQNVFLVSDNWIIQANSFSFNYIKATFFSQKIKFNNVSSTFPNEYSIHILYLNQSLELRLISSNTDITTLPNNGVMVFKFFKNLNSFNLNFSVEDTPQFTYQEGDTSDIYNILNNKADLVHTHNISDVTNLQSTLDNKANLVHNHIIGDVTGLQNALDNKANLSHTHVINDITGLQNALNNKADLTSVIRKDILSSILSNERVNFLKNLNLTLYNNFNITDINVPLSVGAITTLFSSSFLTENLLYLCFLRLRISIDCPANIHASLNFNIRINLNSSTGTLIYDENVPLLTFFRTGLYRTSLFFDLNPIFTFNKTNTNSENLVISLTIVSYSNIASFVVRLGSRLITVGLK